MQEENKPIKRNTLQKSVILDCVLSSSVHPTAEQVYVEAKKRIPSLSLGTVYRVLNELVNDGKVLLVSVPGLPDRFDKTLRSHAHFICLNCGRVIDVEKAAEAIIPAGVGVVEQEVFVLKGLCSECIDK